MVAETEDERATMSGSPAADQAHDVPTISLPPLTDMSEESYTALKEAHFFSRTAHWLVPGRVLCGHYPGSCPSRPADPEAQAERMAQIRDTGVSVFVCLQDELPPQEAPWPEEGVPKQSSRAKWATGNFLNYREAAGDGASFLHFGMPDLSVAASLEELDDVVCDLVYKVERGARLYIHCWGGRGRTGLVSACLLGALYGELDAEAALERVQRYYDLREPSLKKSPETEEQRNQVRRV